MPDFTLSHLDHVAIHATDPYVSVTWYEQVLGLKKMQLKAWGEFQNRSADESAPKVAPRPTSGF